MSLVPKSNTEKGIVFCHTCNNIIGDSFPVNHYHKDFGSGSGAIWLLQHGMYGFSFIVDTPENREKLAKDFPPRTKIEVEI